MPASLLHLRFTQGSLEPFRISMAAATRYAAPTRRRLSSKDAPNECPRCFLFSVLLTGFGGTHRGGQASESSRKPSKQPAEAGSSQQHPSMSAPAGWAWRRIVAIVGLRIVRLHARRALLRLSSSRAFDVRRDCWHFLLFGVMESHVSV